MRRGVYIQRDVGGFAVEIVSLKNGRAESKVLKYKFLKDAFKMLEKYFDE